MGRSMYRLHRACAYPGNAAAASVPSAIAPMVEGHDPLFRRHEIWLDKSVVSRTKARVASFAAPSFHDGSGSVCAHAGPAALKPAAAPSTRAANSRR